MKIKTLLCAGVLAVALVFNSTTSLAGGLHHYKVRYSLHGLGEEIIVAADSTSDARATVQNLAPDAVVYSAIEIH
jgi:predicted transcriptional regulator